jgi:hypothetical protein
MSCRCWIIVSIIGRALCTATQAVYFVCPAVWLPVLLLPQIPQLGVCLNKVPLSDRNIMMAQIKNK